MQRKGLLCIAATTLIAVLASPAQAPASTMTIGSPLGAATTFFGFGQDTTVASVTLSEPGLVRSPVDGRITSWRVRGAIAISGYALRLLHPGSAALEFSGAATSAPVTPAGGGIETFETSLPVKAGDYIGLDIPAGARIGVFSGGSSATFTPKLGEGEARAGSSLPYEATFNAEVEPAPSVYLVGPASGPVSGGTSVAVAGADFDGVTAVRFGSTPATSFTVASEHRLTAVAPASAAAGPVDVTVTTAAGTSATGPDDVFTYAAAPQPPAAPPPRCTVPNLHGKKLKAAKRRVRAAGCSVGRVKKTRGTTARTGHVTRQRPKAGVDVAAGTAVAIVLG